MPTATMYSPNLPVGPYRLEVKASGFKDYVQSGIVLVVNNNIQINVPMQVGSISEQVEVTATTSLVETKENSVSSVIDRAAHQRSAAERPPGHALILTLGAAVYGDSGDTGSKTFWNATRISVAGGQGNGTAYLLDGGDDTDAMSNVNMPFPFPDALQEFSVETSAVSSRFGTHPGATVNVVTKSGSNQFHGDLFEFIRNGDLDARNFFSTTGARHAEAKPVRRHRGRQDHQGQAVLLRRVSGHAQPLQSAAVDHSHSHRGHAERRLQHHRLRRRQSRQSRSTDQPATAARPSRAIRFPCRLLNPVAVALIEVSARKFGEPCGTGHLRHSANGRSKTNTSGASIA